jgi:hypothetical protein
MHVDMIGRRNRTAVAPIAQQQVHGPAEHVNYRKACGAARVESGSGEFPELSQESAPTNAQSVEQSVPET